jgi:hypothetical protein
MSHRTLSITSLALLTLASCLPVPLGDPAKSTIDQKLVGAWTWQEGENTNLAVLRAWDEHTYLLDCMAYTQTAVAIKPKNRNVFKAWLTDVKGQPFITLQPIEVLQPIPGDKNQKYFMTAKLEVKDNTLTATGLDGGYEKFKTAGTATALAKIVSENFDDVRMWIKPIIMTKLAEDAAPQVESVTKSFNEIK